MTKYFVFMNKVSSSGILSWHIHCLLLSYRKIVPFWWKIHLWISLHLIHLQEIRASCQDFFFSPHIHKCVISLLLVVVLFISQLQQKFFSLTYFLSKTVEYSSPGHHCLCQVFANDTCLHSSRDRAKLTARVPQCLKKNSPGRRSSYLQFSMGKTELLLTTICIFFLENIFPSS